MKRNLGYITLYMICGFSGHACGEESVSSTPEAIIRKAIDARGGKEALAKYLNHKVRAKGLMFNGDQKTPVTILYLHRSNPKSYKFHIEISPSGPKPITETIVFNGKHCWRNRNEMATEITGAGFEEAQFLVKRACVCNLLSPLSDKAIFTLSLLPSVPINGKETVGVRVSCKGDPDIDLYFEKKSWMILKSEYRTKNKFGSDESHEELLEAYKKQKGGVFLPTKKIIMENGKKLFEMDLIDIEPITELEDSLFSKP